jgi:ankyrin repeat protein
MVDTDPLPNAERKTPIERADVEREIRRASAREHYKKALRLLGEAGIGVTDSALAHMLLHGCLKGRPSMIEAALDRGLPVDVPNHEGTTALHVAAMFGRSECVLLLLERGADVDRRRDDRRTALILTGQRGDADTMRLLVDEGADRDASAADGDRAVACAAYNGRRDSVDFLVSRGAAVEVDTRSGKTVLQWAQQLRSPWVVASIRRAISLRPRPRSDESP